MSDSTHPSHVGWAIAGGVLFDLDGVITPTASIHEAAWAELFADYDYRQADYLAYIDGRPRYDGVAAFLASRGIDLDWGSPDDLPTADTICGLGNRKNDLFNAVLERDGVEPYPGSIAVLDLLIEHEVPNAIVSSSRNAQPVLTAAGLIDRFPVIVDGVTAAADGLAGKPAPDMFVHAAALLGVEPSSCIVVEDATAGVAAGVAGQFGIVVGVDRGGNRDALITAGADPVVDDLADTLAGAGS